MCKSRLPYGSPWIFEDIIFAPEFFRFFFAIDKVHIGIYFVVHIFLLHL